MNKFNSPEYKRSRFAYVSQAAIGYFVTLLVTDAFLAMLLSYIGMSDAMTGIKSSLVSLAFISQLIAIFLGRFRVSKKTLTTTFHIVSVFIFMFLYIVPFLPLESNVKGIIVFVGVLTAYMCQNAVQPLYFKWSSALIDPNTRAEFSAVKEAISVIGGVVFTTVVGYVIDKYEGLGNVEGAFIFIAISMLVLNILDLISFSLIKKDEITEEEKRKSLKDVFVYIMSNKNLRNVIILCILWEVGNCFTFGFLGIYKIKNLGMSILSVQIINFAAALIRAVISKPFGRYSDKHSFAKGFRLALIIMLVSFATVIFTTKETWYLIIIQTILYNVGLAGTNQNSSNILFSYVKPEFISEALAIKCCIAGICGFLSSIVAGNFLDLIQEKGVTLFGIAINGQQILATISCVILAITIVFAIKVIEKQKNMVK